MVKGNKKIVVKICIVCVAILVLLFLKSLVTFVSNEVFIRKYEKSQIDRGIISMNTLVNFPESYIVHYNLGIGYYVDKQFDKSIDEYNEALKTVPDERVCDVRLNLGLAMAEKIDVNSDDMKDELEKVAKSLLEDSCAKQNGGGRHDGAQELYDEITKTSEESTGDDSDDQGDDEEEEEKPSENSKEEKLERQLREQAEESASERNSDDFSVGRYEYYDGKTW